jgi:CubicO group peptidase (beta-lactamase class C family)
VSGRRSFGNIATMKCYSPAILIFLTGAAALSTGAQTKPARIKGDVVPGATWQLASPESIGYSTTRLEALRAWVKTDDTESMIVVVQGRVIFSYGDVTHTSKVASVRKSVLGMLYGNYVSGGKIDLTKTVKQLGLDDKQPFLPIEESATLAQLLTSRSGIYLPTGSFGQKDYMPPRGSEQPGAHYVYNNWDFNAAGVAFEKQTGRDIYDALKTDLAVPLGMQDYEIAKQGKEYNPESRHGEYVMNLSTRDMARLGLLMLDNGKWNGKQIIPADWIRYMTTLVTPFAEINPTSLRNYGEPERWGYGSLWWVWDQPALPWVWNQPGYPNSVYTGFMQGAYTAAGTGGTYLTVLPAFDLVVVHKVDITKNPKVWVTPSSYMAMLSMIVNSDCGDECQ